MRIGIDIRCLLDEPRSGVGEYTANTLSALLEQDKENRYILFTSGRREREKAGMLEQEFSQRNVDYCHLPWPNKLLNFLWVLKMGPALDHVLNVDVLWLPHFNFARISPRVKLIATCHDISFIYLKHFYSRKSRVWHGLVSPLSLYKRADTIIAVSENTKNDVTRQGITEGKIKVIYPVVKLENADEERMRLTKKKYQLPARFILYIGTLDARKNIAGLLSAYRMYKKRYGDDIQLIIGGRCGWHSRRYYRKLFSALTADGGARYIGYVPHEDKSALYSLASVFVYPSFYEGFGFPVTEAMAAGCPAIISHASSLTEVSRGAAHLVDPYNAANLATALHNVLSDENVRKELIEKGHAAAVAWREEKKRSVEKLEQLFVDEGKNAIRNS